MLQERLEHTKMEPLTDTSMAKGWPYLETLEQAENFAKDKHTSLFDFFDGHNKKVYNIGTSCQYYKILYSVSNALDK